MLTDSNFDTIIDLLKIARKQKSINIGNTFIGIVISLLVVLLAVISFIPWWVACLIYILESILVLLNSQNIVRMDYLLLSYNRKNAKNLLKYKQVYVNNQQISQFDYLLHENDQVEIKKENISSLEILYEDQEFVVINKPSGLLSMSDGKEKEKTAYHYVSEFKKTRQKTKSIYCSSFRSRNIWCFNVL